MPQSPQTKSRILPKLFSLFECFFKKIVLLSFSLIFIPGFFAPLRHFGQSRRKRHFVVISGDLRNHRLFICALVRKGAALGRWPLPPKRRRSANSFFPLLSSFNLWGFVVVFVCRTVPKPLRKTKPVEVKGRRVFGVPLLASLQQTGEPLPPSILRALLHLRAECLGQVSRWLAR